MPDAPIPLGTTVRYHGSLKFAHGTYTVNKLELSAHIAPGVCPDGIAYSLWPVDVPWKFGNRGRALHQVRRSSFTVVCPCDHDEDNICLNGTVYGKCGNEFCGGSCDPDAGGACKSLPGCCGEGN